MADTPGVMHRRGVAIQEERIAFKILFIRKKVYLYLAYILFALSWMIVFAAFLWNSGDRNPVPYLLICLIIIFTSFVCFRFVGFIRNPIFFSVDKKGVFTWRTLFVSINNIESNADIIEIKRGNILFYKGGEQIRNLGIISFTDHSREERIVWERKSDQF